MKPLSIGIPLFVVCLAFGAAPRPARAQAEVASGEEPSQQGTGAPTESTPPTSSEVGSAPAPGDDAAPAAEGEGEAEGGGEEEEESLGHRFQGGLGVLAGTGYYFELAYASNKCSQTDGDEVTAETTCTGMTPMFMEFQGAFGVTAGLEVLVAFRVAMWERRLATGPETTVTAASPTRPMGFGLGARYFTTPHSWFKFFIGALLDIDFTPDIDLDVTVRPLIGVQFDIVRWFGIFIQVSPKIGFIRSFSFAFDGGLGVQARFP